MTKCQCGVDDIRGSTPAVIKKQNKNKNKKAIVKLVALPVHST